MKYFELHPKPENKIEFHLSKLKFIPEREGCYMISNFSGDIMYIGLTNNLKIRFKQHLNSTKKVELTKIGIAFYFFYLLVNDKNKLNQLERGWLNHYELVEGKLPILNTIHTPLR